MTAKIEQLIAKWESIAETWTNVAVRKDMNKIVSDLKSLLPNEGEEKKSYFLVFYKTRHATGIATTTGENFPSFKFLESVIEKGVVITGIQELSQTDFEQWCK